MTESNLASVVSSRADGVIEGLLERVRRSKLKMITQNDEDYPELLREIYDPPIMLFVNGKMPPADIPRVSFVGSRRCTSYGSSCCYRFCKELAKDIVVVSGMALGIDAVAHKGALDGGGYTIAVLGTGADVCYPASNRELMARIVENGCVISEFLPGTKAAPQNFPIRNRIVSGISLGCVVIEAMERSGTIITVDSAFEQGREVFALPGNVTSQFSVGTNRLIKQGANVLTQSKDILDVLGINKKPETKKEEKNNFLGVASDEDLVYDCISFEPISVDEICVRTNLKIQNVQYALLVLELQGRVQKLSAQRYIRQS